MPDLPRQLRLTDAIAVVAGTIIGSGIFLVPNLVARNLDSQPLILGAWIFTGILCGAEGEDQCQDREASSHWISPRGLERSDPELIQTDAARIAGSDFRTLTWSIACSPSGI
jgi:hypothetical protein